MTTSLSSLRRMLVLLVCCCTLGAAAEAATKKGTSTPKTSGQTTKRSVPKSNSTPSVPKKTPVQKPAESQEEEEKKTGEAPKTTPAPPEPPPAGTAKERAPSASLEPADLVEFDAQPPRVQQLIAEALALTKRNLTYTYGSADPEKGGMDCSGTIYYTLRAQGFAEVPRDSSEQYVWVRKAGGFQAVVSTSAGSFEFDALRPGDLLFWSGTYSVEREFPVTHVMLYLGREKKTKQRVMFGASDGRSYHGIQRWGVSVFDFKMPRAESKAETRVDFLGYGPIPGLRGKENDVASAEPPKPAPKAKEPEPVAEAKAETKKTPSAATAKAPAKSSSKGTGSTSKKRKK